LWIFGGEGKTNRRYTDGESAEPETDEAEKETKK